MSNYLNLYTQIKNLESVFQMPADYVTIDVGTFDAAAGTFAGLVTHVIYDPEPIEHRPGQQPVNPQPHYSGNVWISVTIDKNWRRTTTTTPAPKVGLAPVLLKFSIKNHQNASWSVTLAGQTVQVPAGQASVLINIWDSQSTNWTIRCGKSYSDRIMIQRPSDALVGVGAFTVPALPLSIVYAPPADAQALSKTSYGVSQVVGTTSSIQLNADTSTAVPWLPQNLASLQTLQTLLNGISTVLGKVQNVYAQAVSAACGTIASGIGSMSGSATAGTVSSDGRTITLTEAQSQAILAEAKNGGPGQGDVIYYLRDAKFAWVMSGGRLQIALLGGVYASYPAKYLQQHVNEPQTLNLQADVVNMLLALDPFVAGGPTVALNGPRYKDVNAEFSGPLEYGGGSTITGSHQQSYSVSDTRTTTSYSTKVWDYNPAWLGKIFGAQAQTVKSNVAVSRAAGTTRTDTQTISWELHSSPTEHFVVEFWMDQVFGTLALRQQAVSGKPRLGGIAKGLRGHLHIRKPVVLTVGGKTFRTVTNAAGEYAFYSSEIPEGSGSLVIGSEPPQTVHIGKAIQRPKRPQ